MPNDGNDESTPLGVEKVLFSIWLAFLVALIVLFAVIGVRHG
jgi:hypothetical protein